MVCVSLNYRLGLHGFLHIPERGITNLALRDLLCGLQWVQSEIANFGGDPQNVTISGEGAGGIHVCCLLGCPKSYNAASPGPLITSPEIHLFHVYLKPLVLRQQDEKSDFWLMSSSA